MSTQLGLTIPIGTKVRRKSDGEIEHTIEELEEKLGYEKGSLIIKSN